MKMYKGKEVIEVATHFDMLEAQKNGYSRNKPKPQPRKKSDK